MAKTIEDTTIKNILAKLNIMEQMALRKYIVKQAQIQSIKNQTLLYEEAERIDKQLNKDNELRWNLIQAAISAAFRENRISEKREEKIMTKVLEIVKKHEEKGVRKAADIISTDDKVEVLTKDEFLDYVEYKLDTSCKNCRRNKDNCTLYLKFKKHNIPGFNEKECKCEYAYKEEV